MQEILNKITALLEEVRTEKTRLVKSQNYEKARVLFLYEKDLLGIEAKCMADKVADDDDLPF